MYPILLQWKFLTIHTYGLFAALGFILGGALAARWAARHGVPPAAVSDGLLPILLGGLLGARAMYVALHPAEFTSFGEVLKIWQGGLMWQGSLITGTIAGLIHFRRRRIPLPLALDVMAPGVALGHALGRLGCFFAGCCFGRACDLPWAVTFHQEESLAPLGVPLHPTQLYEAFLQLATVGLLTAVARSTRFRPGAGRLAALYLAVSSLVRLAVEFFRNDDRGPLVGPFTPTQVTALALFFIAAFFVTRPAPRV